MARGRPRIEIDWKTFDNLCGLQCTLAEIASFFDCTEDTIQNAVKREKDMSFSVYYEQKRGTGKISLRRSQFKLAEKSAVMAIWLGKQYLEQRDDPGATRLAAGLDMVPDPLTVSIQEEMP